MSRRFRFPVCPCCGGMVELRWQSGSTRRPATPKEFFYGGGDLLPDVAACALCGFHFLDELSPREDEFYAGGDIEGYLRLAPQRRRYFMALMRMVLARGGAENYRRILDVGCASGEWLGCWPDAAERWGVEVNGSLAEVALESGIKIVTELQQTPAEFDLVTALDFLEHMHDPVQTLLVLQGKLAASGTLVLGVPDLGKWIARLLGRRYYLYCPMHYSYFTSSSLRLLLTRLFPGAQVEVFRSPPMHTTLSGALKWLSCDFLKSITERVPIPVGYSASLIGVVRRTGAEQIRNESL